MIRCLFRLLFLHVRSRGWAAGVFPLLAAGIGGALLRERAEDQVVTLLGAVTMPAVLASLSSAAFVSPVARIERSVPAPVKLLEVVHYLAGATLATTVLIALAGGSLGDNAAMTARNSCGYHGLAMLGAGVLGAELAWIFPVLYSTVIAAAVLQYGGNLSGMAQEPWLWPALPGDALVAGCIGPALLVAGVALIAARDRWR